MISYLSLGLVLFGCQHAIGEKSSGEFTKDAKLKYPGIKGMELPEEDIYEDYPEHEPILQPFDEHYEEEQKGDLEETKVKKEESEIPNNVEEMSNDIEDQFHEEKHWSGVSDHEPMYQPEDPGELPDSHDSNTVSFEHEKAYGDESPSSNGVEFNLSYDDHEPIYQPFDEETNEISHEEL